jgi:hypothetical protein
MIKAGSHSGEKRVSGFSQFVHIFRPDFCAFCAHGASTGSMDGQVFL